MHDMLTYVVQPMQQSVYIKSIMYSLNDDEVIYLAAMDGVHLLQCAHQFRQGMPPVEGNNPVADLPGQVGNRGGGDHAERLDSRM